MDLRKSLPPCYGDIPIGSGAEGSGGVPQNKYRSWSTWLQVTTGNKHLRLIKNGLAYVGCPAIPLEGTMQLPLVPRCVSTTRISKNHNNWTKTSRIMLIIGRASWLVTTRCAKMLAGIVVDTF